MKHALVTGCSSGIGLAVTKALLSDGWSVVGISRSVPNLESCRFRHIALNVCDRSRMKLRIDTFCNEFPLDALIHCAGNQGEIGPLEETAPPWWVQTVEENLIGAYYVVYYALPYLRKVEDARILLFSGGGAHEPFPNYSAYAVSKAGVVRLMETLAVELAPQISVNCVAPGFIVTNIHQRTLDVGPEKAGEQYQRVVEAMTMNGAAHHVARVVACVKHLLDPETLGLTGRTISVMHDPWPSLNAETVPLVSGGTTTRTRMAIDLPQRVRERERVLL